MKNMKLAILALSAFVGSNLVAMQAGLYTNIKPYETEVARGFSATRTRDGAKVDAFITKSTGNYGGSQRSAKALGRALLYPHQAKEAYNDLEREHNRTGYTSEVQKYKESFERPDTGERLDK